MSSIPGPSLNHVPQEILDQILDDLEEDAPRLGEEAYLRAQPYLFSRNDKTQNEQHQQNVHLKSLSLVSKRLRAGLFDRLFIHLQLTLYPPLAINTQRHPPRDELFTWIADLSKIATFIRHNDLSRTVKSFVMKIVDGEGHYRIDTQEAYRRDLTKESASIGQHWHRLLDEAPLLKRLTIIAPPFCLGVMISVPLKPWISENLHMPYQILSLGRETNPPPRSAENDLNSQSSLLSTGGWTSVLLNEGSFIRWYTQLSPRHQHDELLSASSGTTRLPKAFCAGIKSFEYIGIYPTIFSFERLVFNTLKAMPVLRSFSFKLHPSGDLLYDTEQRRTPFSHWIRDAIKWEYELIRDTMIAPPVLPNTAETVHNFHNIDHIRCLDQGVASRELWQLAIDDLDTREWSINEDDDSLRRRYRQSSFSST